MLVLAAADTLAGVADAATTVTCTIFGMELAGGVETYRALYQGQLPAAAATIYTVPAATTSFVKSIHIVNTAVAATHTFQLFRGGTAAANQITPVVTIPAGGFAVYDERGWQVYTSAGALVQQAILTLISIQVLTASGTFTTPTGARALRVRCIGGGGGGGGTTTTTSSSAVGAGGGGGGYAEALVTAPAATYAYTIGAGGTAGAATGAAGGAGGATSFGSPSVCTANGGAGGAGMTTGTTAAQSAGGAGGAVATAVGTVLAAGTPGESANRVSGTVAASGDGGAAPGTGGGGGIGLIAQSAGAAGGQYGGGGSGGCTINGGAAVTGGAGAAGAIIVEVYG